ncbi:acetyl-CoA C-acyltransferase [Stappia taiwanensis]|uniref:Acetyl-CoA C-acyltransferase n=1 Tax=Stappia taiwanensis TaxID=992267 RepID=A0A838XUZ8_9HYPH|nr:acetyl-CoA C-acyltransferase [Stappia taiwanensis]MBA4613557.1 acetyl-CoA C-acyltransferase [Stappia taiwanensis]GGE96705.1 acetyl-CoA acetyltransferase [Stappia taiwanensis]
MTAFIYDAVRTARGKARPDGGLAAQKPHDLVAALAAAIKDRAGAAPSPEALILGCVGQIGAQGGNLALVSKLAAGIDEGASAFTVNNYCVSGLTAIGQAAAMVASGQAGSALAGGVEMMSAVPFLADKASYYTDASFPPRTRFLPVALAADRLAEEEGITREEMDALALLSQRRAAEAEGTALTASRIPVAGLDREESVRATSAEALAALAPAFSELAGAYAEALQGRRLDHRHTIAHAPPMCDGAALALIGAEGAASAAPRARILAWAEVGGDPAASLTAGFAAMDRALDRAGLRLEQMDRIEFMEAFGVAIAKFMRDRAPDPDKVNVGGGHMAKGHPLGASGAILLSTLLDTLDAAGGRYGLVVATGASGTGSAMIVERQGA